MNRLGYRRATQINILIGVLQFVFSIVTGFVLVPLYLKYIQLDIYGAWLAATSCIAWVTIMDPGLSNVLMQKIAKAISRDDAAEVGKSTGSGIILVGLLAAMFFLIGLLVTQYLDIVLKLGAEAEEIKNACLYIVGASALMILYYGTNAFNYAYLSSAKIGVAYLTALLIKIIAIIVFVRSGYGVQGLALAELIMAVLLVVVGIGMMYVNFVASKWQVYFSIDHMKAIAGLSVYSFGARVGKLASNGIDNILVSRVIGQESVVLYNVTKRLPATGGNALTLPVAGFRATLSRLYGDNDVVKMKSIILRLSRLILFSLGLFAATLFLLNDYFVALWVGEALFAGVVVSNLLVLLIVVSIWCRSFTMINFAIGGIKSSSSTEIISAILSIVFMIIGVNFYSLIGLISGHILAVLVTSFWYVPHLIAKRLSLSHAEVKGIYLEAVSSVGTAGFTYLIFRGVLVDSWYGFLTTTLLIAFAYCFFLALISSTFRSECKALIHVLGRVTHRF